jgi:hypothetical protein
MCTLFNRRLSGEGQLHCFDRPETRSANGSDQSEYYMVADMDMDVTPLVLLALKLEHDIMCIDISCCLSHLEWIH